jgi:hypothetical protein
MSGALLFSTKAIKAPSVGEENVVGGVEGGGEVAAQVGDGDRAEIDNGVQMM